MRDPSISAEKEMGIGSAQDSQPLDFRSRLSSAWGQEGVSPCRVGTDVLQRKVGLRLSSEASSLGRRTLDLLVPCSVPAE